MSPLLGPQASSPAVVRLEGFSMPTVQARTPAVPEEHDLKFEVATEGKLECVVIEHA